MSFSTITARVKQYYNYILCLLLGLPYDFKEEYEILKQESEKQWTWIILLTSQIEELNNELSKYKGESLWFIKYLDFVWKFEDEPVMVFKKIRELLAYLEDKMLRDSYSLHWMGWNEIHQFRRWAKAMLQLFDNACKDVIKLKKAKDEDRNFQIRNSSK